MKKLIILLLFAIASYSSFGQAAPASAYYSPFATNSVIVTNATTTSIATPRISTSGYEGLVTVQCDIVNATGTIAGNVYLQGSVTGINYATISTDTFKLSTTNTSHVWTVNPVGNNYLQLLVVPTGTQSDTLRGYYVLKMKR